MTDPWILLAILVMLVLAAVAGGLWIAVALGLVGVLAIYLGASSKISFINLIPWNTWNSFILTAVPLYLFMGELLVNTGIAKPFYRALNVWIQKLPGGLLQTNVFGCAVFAAMSGVSIASAATFGSLSLKELKRQGYDTKFSLGSVAGPAMLGILIPPSIPLVIYGAMVNQSIGRLFMAGVIPGIIFTITMVLYIGTRSKLQPRLVPREVIAVSWKQRIESLKHILPIVTLILLILGGIYGGWFTPTEAGAIGAAGVLLISLGYGLTWKTLKESLIGATRTTCLAFFLVVGAQILSLGLVSAEIPRRVAESITSLSIPPVAIIASLYLLYLVLGCFIDGLSMMLLTLPVVYPIVVGLGYDPIWFGIALVINIELGLITPPFGFNLFVVQGVSGEDLLTVAAGSMPYVFLGIFMLVLITAYPGVVTWLPNLMRGG
ncbi:MAG: TRAP transporter large permease [Chloroflexi bacterium]|nr:TRAP transporter large permease [Chloroflexota bacterium]